MLDALGLGKISVGAPYFETVFVPLMTPVLLLMGVGPLARWKSSSAADLARKLRWPALLGVIAALTLPLAAGRFSVGIALGLLLAGWVFASTTALLAQRLRGEPGGGMASRLAQLARSSPSFFGMALAHAGVGVFIVGVTMVKGYELERDVKMALGDSVQVAGYVFTFQGVEEFEGPNYVGVRGTLRVQHGDDAPFVMHPEKRLYKVQQMPMTEAAIDSGLWRDLYVSLGEPLDAATWTVRVYHKPFVDWIWFGALAMALGGLLAAGDRRYRAATQREAQPAAGPRLGATVATLCLLLLALPVFAGEAQPVAADPVLETTRQPSRGRTALPGLPEPVARRFARAAGRRPEEPGARAAARRPQRCAGDRLHDAALWRLRALPPAGQGQHLAALGRAAAPAGGRRPAAVAHDLAPSRESARAASAGRLRRAVRATLIGQP